MAYEARLDRNSNLLARENGPEKRLGAVGNGLRPTENGSFMAMENSKTHFLFVTKFYCTQQPQTAT